jgi:hypothetical protein
VSAQEPWRGRRVGAERAKGKKERDRNERSWVEERLLVSWIWRREVLVKVRAGVLEVYLGWKHAGDLNFRVGIKILETQSFGTYSSRREKN